MKYKEYLESLIKDYNEKITGLRSKIQASESVEEVRNLTAQIEEYRSLIADAEKTIRENPDGKEEEQRGKGLDPKATYGERSAQDELNDEFTTDEQRMLSNINYRKAFMEYVQRGTINGDLITRAGGDPGTTITSDIGMLIPMTIMNEIIEKVSGVYGTIWSKVRKMNIKGGVKFPIGNFKANFHWITETTVSNKQKIGEANDYIEFSYHIGEIRVANSMLSSIVSLPVFEEKITESIVEAYLEAMDDAIINGDGVGKPLGITKDPRVTNVVEFTEEEFGDWTAWHKKLFSIIPLRKRGQGEFLFTNGTVETYLRTMRDDVNRPMFSEAVDLSLPNSGTTARIFGREIQMVEPNIIEDFATAENGDVIGVFWVPRDYGVNSQMEFGMRRYFDEDTNEWISKALTVVDGKIIDPQGCYILKKKVE